MTDIVSKTTRSKMMSGIRSQDTAPELVTRRELHRRGFRFRLQRKDLPGRPDLVLPKHSAVIFVHGCFWHGHDCRFFKWPASRTSFWREKILGNRLRDRKNVRTLLKASWRVVIIWECELRTPATRKRATTFDRVTRWLHSSSSFLCLPEPKRRKAFNRH